MRIEDHAKHMTSGPDAENASANSHSAMKVQVRDDALHAPISRPSDKANSYDLHSRSDMDLTEFLQTEGRRRAAELARCDAQSISDARIKFPNNIESTMAALSASHRPIQLQPGQQQSGIPTSLSEALQQMGVLPKAHRR